MKEGICAGYRWYPYPGRGLQKKMYCHIATRDMLRFATFSAFATMYREALHSIRLSNLCVHFLFNTVHTPVPAGHDYFDQAVRQSIWAVILPCWNQLGRIHRYGSVQTPMTITRSSACRHSHVTLVRRLTA